MTKKPRILLVDDELAFLNSIARIFRMDGYDIEFVTNATDAYALLCDGEKFDLVVSDNRMPGLTGSDFAVKIRKELGLQNLPILVLSGGITDKRRKELDELGSISYLEKPAAIDDIRNTVSKLLPSNE